jgi:hypothetical protein
MAIKVRGEALVRFSFYIPVSLRDKFKDQAIAQAMSVSELLRLKLAAFENKPDVGTYEHEEQGESPAEKIKALAQQIAVLAQQIETQEKEMGEFI